MFPEENNQISTFKGSFAAVFDLEVSSECFGFLSGQRMLLLPRKELLLHFPLVKTLEPQFSEVRRKMWRSSIHLTGTLGPGLAVGPPQAQSGGLWLTYRVN